MNRRLAAIVLASTALLALVALATARTAEREAGLVFSYASTDAGPGGVLGLRRWLASLGYHTRSVQGQRFSPPEDAHALFVIGPLEPVRPEEAQRLRDWVAQGRLLLVASDRGLVDEALFAAFGASLEDRAAGPIEGSISPALSSPAFRDLSTGTARALALREPAAVHVGDGERAIVATRRVGRGRVFLSSAPDMLANANIRSAGNDRLVLNLLAGAPRDAVVAFDEFHHGAHVEPDLMGILVDTAPGRALLFAGLVAFAYVALRGRRFGAAVPLEERPARSSLDYVRSFAALLRRSRAGGLAAERLARLYRRRVARVLGLRRTASDEDVVAALARHDAERAAALREMLLSFARAPGERELLHLAARAEALLDQMERPGRAEHFPRAASREVERR